jgi:hypothetical protein
MLGLVEDMVGSSAHPDSRPKTADHHHRQGMPITAVSTCRLHLPDHADCSKAALKRRADKTRRSENASRKRSATGSPDMASRKPRRGNATARALLWPAVITAAGACDCIAGLVLMASIAFDDDEAS